jgi:hypothetical protein
LPCHGLTVTAPAHSPAAQAEAEASASADAGASADIGKPILTLLEWFNQIWPSWDIEATTRANYSAPIRRFIVPAFGPRPLKSIIREKIDR